MNGNELRSRFLNFFKKKGHTIKKSASLIPDDPSVLFSIAGMVQFKRMFLGEIPLDFTRAATAQKCIRTNDIENVGKTARHHTFFEMLGNFSFGDYFKKEAIVWGWEFLTDEIKLPSEKLYATIYINDEESFEIWNKVVGLPENRIFRLGEDSNFWTMGDTGPCGPCSEIIYDLGPDFGCGKPGCNVGCDCDRYLELWNLVFTQFDRSIDGKLTPLPQKNIDTGMGLERLARVMQKTNNNFETDLIFPIIEKISKDTELIYGQNKNTDMYLKIIADHIRAIAFLIIDGVIPSNEERGYVLRKLIRRSVVHGKQLGYNKLFLYELSDTVIQIMKDSYPELLERKKYISDTILAEEENFVKTLERANDTFIEIIERVKKSGVNLMSGDDAFILSDTYGLPISITETMAQKYGIKIDIKTYEKLLISQQNRSREDWHKKITNQQDFLINTEISDTKFIGYSTLNSYSKILHISENIIENAEGLDKSINVIIILDTTPFYAESGGQLGDTGALINGKENKIIIENTVKHKGYYIHIGKLVQGKFHTGDEVEASVNKEHRKDTARNHTATHLLQSALRQVLGNHVTQAGSLVSHEYLRFDFTHFSNITKRELLRIEELVNENILNNIPVEISEKTLKEAKKEGAMALFGEKYGNMVRMVKVGDVSKELCGGTHAKDTGEIGLFKILKEESVGSGIRRIEAITAHMALDWMRHQVFIIEELSEITKSLPDAIKDKIIKLQETIKIMEKEEEKFKSKIAGDKLQSIINMAEEIKDIKIISGMISDTNIDTLRTTIDNLKSKFSKGIFILGSSINGKTILIIGITKNLTPGLNAGMIIKETTGILGGKGGGRPDLAEAGGTEMKKLEDAISHALKITKEKVSNFVVD